MHILIKMIMIYLTYTGCNVYIVTYTSEFSQYLPSDFKTTWMQEKKLNDEENNV